MLSLPYVERKRQDYHIPLYVSIKMETFLKSPSCSKFTFTSLLLSTICEMKKQKPSTLVFIFPNLLLNIPLEELLPISVQSPYFLISITSDVVIITSLL